MWTALIGAGVDMYNGQMNRLSGFLSQKKQYKFNKKLQEDQQAFQRQMWELSNQYNLPVNEIQRLVDAGINPSAAFSNGGASAAPVPNSGTAGGVSAASFPSSPSIGGQLASNLIAQERVESEVALNAATAERQKAEAAKFRSEADESSSRKNLLDNEYAIRSNPEYIKALSESPRLSNDIRRLDRDMKSLDYSFELYNYGNRIESADLSLDQQKLNYLTSGQNLLNLRRDYDRIGAHIRNLDAGTAEQREHARVLRQDLDIRAGKALLGTLEYEALRYCQEHGVRDSVTGQIRDLVSAMADEYSSKVFEGTYSSRSSSVVSSQDIEYQSQHGQERRAYETELIRRKGNYLRTSQWNMSINTGLNFVRTAFDLYSASKSQEDSGGSQSLITPNSAHSNMPFTPEARDILLKVFPEVERRLQY